MSGKPGFSVNVKSCVRCGGDHPRLRFEALGRPARDFQWWALCPTTGEPILMRSTIDEERAAKELRSEITKRVRKAWKGGKR